MGARLPVEKAPGFTQVVFLFGFIAGDEDRIEAAVTDLHRLQRRKVGIRQVLFV